MGRRNQQSSSDDDDSIPNCSKQHYGYKSHLGCIKCNRGYYLEGVKNTQFKGCKKCPTGCSECDGPDSCQKCYNGHYLTNTSTCLKCPDDLAYKCKDLTGDTTECTSGAFLPQGANRCKACITGCKTCDNEYTCKKCNWGWRLENSICRKKTFNEIFNDILPFIAVIVGLIGLCIGMGRAKKLKTKLNAEKNKEKKMNAKGQKKGDSSATSDNEKETLQKGGPMPDPKNTTENVKAGINYPSEYGHHEEGEEGTEELRKRNPNYKYE